MSCLLAWGPEQMLVPPMESCGGRNTWEGYASESTGHRRHTRLGRGRLEERLCEGVGEARGNHQGTGSLSRADNSCSHDHLEPKGAKGGNQADLWEKRALGGTVL